MHYVRKETYTFDIPREYTAYLKFKKELTDLGVTFIDEGGHSHQEIVVYTRGIFDKSKEVMDADGR